MTAKKKTIIPKNRSVPTLCIQNSLKAFTLIELIVVVVVISMVAAFAIPNYQKAIRRAHERNAILHLTTIHGANEIFRAGNREYWIDPDADLAEINAGLSINIIDNEMEYVYGGDADNYTVMAIWTGTSSFTARVNQGAIGGGNPCCTTGNCPILSDC